MLYALRTLGEILGGARLHDPVVADRVITLEFDAGGRYLGTSLHQFSAKDVPRYLYKKAKGSNPPTLTPTLLLNRKEIQKSLKNARNAYRKLRKLNRDLPELELLTKEGETLRKMEKGIVCALKNIPEKERVLFTVRIDGQWMGEREDFRSTLRSKFREEGRESAVDGVCAVCGEKTEISGDISPFKFYTIDKPGYVVGGFDKARAYRAFPLCYECRDLIRRGRQHAEENLSFDLAPNIRYLIIPDFILGADVVRQEVLAILTDEREQRQKRLHTLSRREIRRITEDEEEILELLSQEKDVMTFHFLFMSRQQGRETIDLYIQDVYPSRLRALLEAKAAVDRSMRVPREDGTWLEYNFTYATLHRFFSRSDPNRRNSDLLRHLYDLVDQTFRAVPVSTDYLMPFLMLQIRHDVVTPDRRDQGLYRFTILDALAVLLFIWWTTKMEVPMTVPSPTTLEEFLDGLPVLDSELKKGLFLLGALTERLLRVQGKERGSAPFWKVLKGLKMTEADLRGLLPRVRNKLQEYDRFRAGETALFQKAADYLAQTATPWKMSVDELNFYFALGMGLFPRVAQFVYPKKEEVEL
ncbi:TIGR02556 family CRISPR-associated protein [Rhodothermus marinus]|uniref:TIGR02556 family CRISPR-associated protein n=1 Tax=Rhodothermus marinus TaxID=29549 RepID=UPI0012BA503E|nr:TIGR02556 family CRISPR-associated protein [Rhodothermus marinus]BBM69590.1 type I-B CRISPR-associated protein Cas8b/Csh1 [Rhodothermus marinus]BBM72572.1 type I-B CRISPR-associated protein Cas8b/Csh1 [Rhodothermus marinus]